MLTTFASATNTDSRPPRHRLRPGVTEWHSYPRARARQSKHHHQTSPPAEPAPLNIPASATAFALETLAFPLDPKQREVLDADARRVLVCCTRQWGKSTLAAIKILHSALLHPNSLILIASRTQRQAGELLHKVIRFALDLDLPIRRAPLHPDSLLLPNQSRVIALPGQPESLRGFSAVSLLVFDEAAYIPDALYHALRPMLATTNGALWLLSTPRGQQGFFYQEWSAENDGWARFSVQAPDCPRIPPAFLEEERRLHGPAIFNREYLCEFAATSGESYFDIEALDTASEQNRYQSARDFANQRPAARFYLGFDLGQKQSFSAVALLERVTGRSTQHRDPVTFSFLEEHHLIVRTLERFPLHTTYDDVARRLKSLIASLGDVRDVTLIVDATGCGQPFLDILRKHQLGALLVPVCITSGGTPNFSRGTQRVSKKDLLASANYVLASPALKIAPGLAGLAALRQEMDAYRVKTSMSGSPSFQSNQSDDLVMAFALASWKARPFLPPAPS